MAILAGDFRTGLTLMIDGDPWVVLDFQHVKPGKGAAILKTKMKNLKTGSTQERNFNASTKFEAAMIERKTLQYSYEAGGIYTFMDMETFETFELSADQIGYNKNFLVEGQDVGLVFFEGQVLDVTLPATVVLEIVECDPVIKGAPSTQTKDAVCSTGLKIRVPQFIDNGEMVEVYTTDGSYKGRA